MFNFLEFQLRGSVSVVINSAITEESMFCFAFPDNIGWVQKQYTSIAPADFNACAAPIIVPPVSIMSSTINTFLLFTSPIMFIT